MDRNTQQFDCAEINNLMNKVLSEDGPSIFSEKIRSHICQCSRCSAEWGGLAEILSIPDAVPVQLPENRTWSELAQRTRTRIAIEARNPRFEEQPVFPLVAAIGIGLFMFLIIPAGFVAAYEICFYGDIFIDVELLKHYGIALAVQFAVFQVLVALLAPLITFPLQPGKQSRRLLPGLRLLTM